MGIRWVLYWGDFEIKFIRVSYLVVLGRFLRIDYRKESGGVGFKLFGICVVCCIFIFYSGV